jgi:hypothetical protein
VSEKRRHNCLLYEAPDFMQDPSPLRPCDCRHIFAVELGKEILVLKVFEMLHVGVVENLVAGIEGEEENRLDG